MKRYCPAVCLLICVLLFSSSCQKNAAAPEKVKPTEPKQPQVAPPQAAAVPAAKAQVTPAPGEQPKLTFEKVFHDFGKIPPAETVTCEFKFTNTGKGLLKITDVHAPCGCTTPQLEKKEYQPGESGSMTVKYRSPNKPRLDTKNVYVQSNDPNNPKTTLTIRATIVNKVSVEPEKLSLSLRQPNAGCSNITLASTDNQPFSIKQIEVTGDCMAIDFNSTVQATQFVLQPKVDVEKFRQTFNLEGIISIDLTHPGCQSVSVPFAAVSEFKVDPPTVAISRAEPNVPVSRQVSIRNNYNEPFEVESLTSRMGYTKIIEQVKDPNGGCIFDLQITPPPMRNQNKMFSDALMVKIKNGELFRITCRGFYAKPSEKPPAEDAK